MEFSLEIKKYFEDIQTKINKAYETSSKARSIGHDPELQVEILLAQNLAERVEKLVSVVAPQIMNTSMVSRILELEKKYGKLDWRVALDIALEVAQQKFCIFSDIKTAMETGIRVGLAYITLGIVSSPIEGFVELIIRKTRQGKEYFCLMYAGPIRSAGGTGAAVSVLIADYIRKKMGYDAYDPREDEIKRMVTELYDYHERVTNLQYLPSREEIDFLVRYLPVQIDGSPSEDIEVSNYKDLERIQTNKIRNGPCLVLGECLAQKSPKIWAQLSKWGGAFSLEHWNFLKDFVQLQKGVKAKGEINTEEKYKLEPIYTYIQDLVAGRPVLTHPLATGGFRLRYGRSRCSGYSSAALHPATTLVLNHYIATGTQLKMERPGKATALSLCDSIEGPVIKLNNGNVMRIETESEAKQLASEVKEILFLGDILINYGDFYNRAHPLVPAGYCEEWWVRDVEKAVKDLYSDLDLVKTSNLLNLDKERLCQLLQNPHKIKPSIEEAITMSKKLYVPLHPRYTYYWKTINLEKLMQFLQVLVHMNIVKEQGEVEKLVIPLREEAKRATELLGIPHTVSTEHIVVEKEDAKALLATLNINDVTQLPQLFKIVDQNKGLEPLELVNKFSDIIIRDKGGTFVGARMGRPEKAKIRKLTGSPHTLFPIGEEGGKLRSFQSAIASGKITAEFAMYRCTACQRDIIFGVCDNCNQKTIRMYYCINCGPIEKAICRHGPAIPYKKIPLDIKSYFEKALNKLGMKSFPDMIKGVHGTSNKEHIPENFIKGILRAKHNIAVNKDGTTRYDMTQLVITHFRPGDIGTPIKKLMELGYHQDIEGKPLQKENQLLELKPQDLILPACPESPDEGCDEILFRTANFMDELLTAFYGLKPFYNLKEKNDIIGHLVLAIAPHISTGVVGRILGFSKTQGFFTHPMFHAAMRRDCDGDEASVTLLLDGLINFSRKFLPDTAGSTQDAPLVLTPIINPTEVDDMLFDVDTIWKYPLEFYEACQQFKMPWEIKIEQISKRLNTTLQYEGYGFTHDVSNINIGVRCSAYKTLPSMEDKLKGQMDLADKIRAVSKSDVARLVIEKHFLRDIRGNLRKFSQQEFRCVKCNEKYRRPPLVGKCIKCSGRLIFTVSEGSITKYLEPAISLAHKYNVDPYLKQVLVLTKQLVEEIFGKETDKQSALGRWFG